jgi:cobalamin biosynthesis protein CobC
MKKLIHGGQLTAIAAQFKLEVSGWLDLSTGVSPYSYSKLDNLVPCLSRLPELCEDFMSAAKAYYQTDNLLATHGSQAAIKVIPLAWLLLNQKNVNRKLKVISPRCRVFLPLYGYKEHEKAWRTFQYEIIYYQSINEIAEVNTGDAIVVINPNNPTAELIGKKQLLALRSKAIKKGCLLVVDEAFMDAMPLQYSLLNSKEHSCCVILRSFGKFFGLAGLRLGFVNSSTQILALLDDLIGPWQVTHFAQSIAQQAFKDKAWQDHQKQRLSQQSNKLVRLLARFFPANTILMTPLFVSVRLEQAEVWFTKLAQKKVYIRLWDDKSGLRFGIPQLNDMVRLETALTEVAKLIPVSTITKESKKMKVAKSSL